MPFRLRGPVKRVLTSLLGLAAVLLVLGALLRWTEPRLLYFPLREIAATPAAIGLPYEDVMLQAEDGVRIHGWWVPSPRSDQPVTVLFLHGNAGNISFRLEKLRILHAMGTSTLIIDYRGYGRSEGRPDEAGLYRDARAAYTHLVDRRQIVPDRLVLYGESLGTAVAVDLAAQRPVGGLVLEAAFTSVPDAGRDIYPWLPVRWIARSRFDSLAKIGRVHAPLLVLQSRDDEFFGLQHAERLVAAAPGPSRLVELRGGHNEAFATSTDVYRSALREFLSGVRRAVQLSPAGRSR